MLVSTVEFQLITIIFFVYHGLSNFRLQLNVFLEIYSLARPVIKSQRKCSRVEILW